MGLSILLFEVIDNLDIKLEKTFKLSSLLDGKLLISYKVLKRLIVSKDLYRDFKAFKFRPLILEILDNN